MTQDLQNGCSAGVCGQPITYANVARYLPQPKLNVQASCHGMYADLLQ